MPQRFRKLNQHQETPGEVVIYHMSRDQRVGDNHTLLSAQKYALKRQLPLLVIFNLFTQPAPRLLFHYQFMVNGLQQVEEKLTQLGIGMVLTHGDPVETISNECTKRNAAALFMDFSPLYQAVQTRVKLAETLPIPVIEIDSSNVVPLWLTSDKEEFSAKTIRGKIHRHLDDFLIEPDTVKPHSPSWENHKAINWQSALASVVAENPPFYQPKFIAGEAAAQEALKEFIVKRLALYGTKRNNPTSDALSDLSPYFHYGQLSTLRANLEVKKTVDSHSSPEIRESADAFLEESIVRRELAQNFCYYNANYKSFNAAREWAKKTLKAHESDPREWTYTRTELEKAATHDPAWNASQRQMMRTGKMHGYMRMYWAKKILEWSSTVQDAIDSAIYLNDKYHLDGYDANGYVGILWAICGIHDRPWFERPIYGSIRYMNDNGLRRKFDIDRFVTDWSKPIKL